MAKYCSQFCQHKDWEDHHKECANNNNNLNSKNKPKINNDSNSDANSKTAEDEKDDDRKSDCSTGSSGKVSPKLIKNKETAAAAALTTMATK